MTKFTRKEEILMQKIYILSVSDTIIGAYTSLDKAKQAADQYVIDMSDDFDAYEEALDASDRHEPFQFVIKIVEPDQPATQTTGDTLNQIGTIVGKMIRHGNEIEIEYQSTSISDYLAANNESLQEITRAYVDPEELTENPDDPEAYVEDSMTDITLAVIDNDDGHIIYEGDADEIIKYLKNKVAGKTEEDK